MTEQIFQFQPRWKEELVVIGSGGAFVLELPMGGLSAYLPTEAEWRQRAPAWARPLWPMLNKELENWCDQNNARLHITPDAGVDPL